MYKRTVMHGVARLLQVMGLALMLPLLIAYGDADSLSFGERMLTPEIGGFAITIAASLLTGSIITRVLRRYRRMQSVREGFAVVGIGWMVLALFGSIPLFVYMAGTSDVQGIAGYFTLFTDSLFEIMSGFTTTGATILTDIESLPRGLLFWRSLTHWLGGMGIVTLALVIFPALGVSGYHMFKSEVPGPSTERLQPRLAETAMALWGVYALLTLVESVLLILAGMNLFDAVCHSFGTMATGGFSTKNASIAHYSSGAIHWIIVLFMFLAGVNFLLHFNALRGKALPAFKDGEFRFYTGIIVFATMFATVVLFFQGLPLVEQARESFRQDAATYENFALHMEEQAALLSGLYGCFREAAFQVVSITTTTGYCTADFDVWPGTLRFLLLILMFVGGCAGSTGGGMKMIRIVVVLKAGWRETVRMARPRVVRPIKVGGVSLDETRVGNIVSFVLLFLSLTAVSSLLMTLFVPDLLTAFTSVAACIANIGPGLAGVGAVENYAWMPDPAKWILIFNMLLGRLEIFTILVLLRPSVWR